MTGLFGNNNIYEMINRTVKYILAEPAKYPIPLTLKYRKATVDKVLELLFLQSQRVEGRYQSVLARHQSPLLFYGNVIIICQ